jgi:hypothetical protein
VKLQNETIHELRAEIDQMHKETNKLQNITADELGVRNYSLFASMHTEIEALRSQIGQMLDEDKLQIDTIARLRAKIFDFQKEVSAKLTIIYNHNQFFFVQNFIHCSSHAIPTRKILTQQGTFYDFNKYFCLIMTTCFNYIHFSFLGGFSQNVPKRAKAETGQLGKGRHFHWRNFQNEEIGGDFIFYL